MTGGWWRRLIRPRSLLIAMGAFYAAASGAVATHVVLDDRREAIARLEASTADTARLLDEHIARTLDAAELVLGRLAERGAAARLDGGYLAEVARTAPALSNLLLLNDNGRVVADARGARRPGADLSTLEWLAPLRAGQARLVIGRAGFDEASGSWVFPVAMRTPGGAAAAIIDIDSFRDLCPNNSDLRSLAFGVGRLDGAALVRQPLNAEAVSGNLNNSLLYEVYLPKAPNGTFRGPSALDGGVRVISYRTVPERGLVVWASMSEDEALGPWSRRATWSVTLGLAALAVMATFILLLVREIARERAAAAALAAANRDLARSNADLEQFAYVASHDLKEPLRNIASYVQLLQRRYQGKLDPDADAFIGYTVDGVRRLQSIINELLNYSRTGTGKLDLQPVQAGAAVSAALANLKTAIAEGQVAVEIRGPLPVVTADPQQLVSVFQNLIGNALKYRRVDARPEVTVGAVERGALWEFYIADNGIGIEGQYHAQIFELFKRLHSRDSYTGTGIGLALCKRIVERHGGTIWVDSELGRGSTFRFTLPRA
ncbi:MAG: sensor histidine kinase [Solirubrobacterales bacterium]